MVINMVSIFELLLQERDKIEELKKLREDAIKEKLKEEQNEAELWLSTPFKEKGLTNDDMRRSYIKQQMILLYPSFYKSKQAQIATLKEEIAWIRETIRVLESNEMVDFDVDKYRQKNNTN